MTPLQRTQKRSGLADRGMRHRASRMIVASVVCALGAFGIQLGTGGGSVPASAIPSGTVDGYVFWPDDVNLRANDAVWAIADANNANNDPAWGPRGSQRSAAIIASGQGTPTRPVVMMNNNPNVATAGTEEMANLAVSANLANKGNDGIWTTRGLAVTDVRATATTPGFTETYGISRSANVLWSPASGPRKGERLAIEIPWPAGFSSQTCGMEVNPYDNSLVVLNDCNPSNTAKYLVFYPGPDGDPLTISDNSFTTVQTTGSLDPGRYSDFTIDALGNIYNLSRDPLGTGNILRTNAITGQVTNLGSFTSALTNSAAPGTGNVVSASATYGLGFLDGKIVHTAAGEANRGQQLAGVDPLTKTAVPLPGFPAGALNGGNSATGRSVVLDGAGTQGAIGFDGVVRDTSGNGVPGQTVAFYQDNGDGTAAYQGSATTDANGAYATLLNRTVGTTYARVVQPQITTGSGATAQVKNGEVVAIDPSMTINDGSNAISAMNQRDNGVNPPATATITVADTDDLVKVDGNSAAVFYRADFSVKFAGSTADLSRNSLLSADTTAGLGPQHLNGGDPNVELKLGESDGSYLVGATDNSHDSDDGVALKISGANVPLDNQIFARGTTYSLLATSTGAQAPNAKVSAWITAPVAGPTTNPRGAFGALASGSGAEATLSLVAPASSGFSTVRVNSSMMAITKPDNSSGDYAASATTATKPWTTAGEVEDYNVMVTDAVVRLRADAQSGAVPVTFAYSLSNVSNSAPSSNSDSITVTELDTPVSSSTAHAVTTAGSPVTITKTNTSNFVLVDALCADTVTDDPVTSVIANGKVSVSPASGSDITCTLEYQELEPSVAITGVKKVAAVSPSLVAGSPADADNWNLTVTESSETKVISGSSDVKLDRGKTYTLGEQLRSVPAPAENAHLYPPLGEPVCTDAHGSDLPAGVFDAASSTIQIGATILIDAPIRCEIVNQTSEVGLVVKRLGGQTSAPSTDWSLSGEALGAGDDFVLDESAAAREALPGVYGLTASAPAGLAIVGLQKLDLSDAQCAASADNAIAVPENCWITLDSGASDDEVEQGYANVYRVVAAAPEDMPQLPMTGGLGSWIFSPAGICVLLLAALAYWLWRRESEKLRRPAESRSVDVA